MTGDPHDINRIVLSYNPILCICLACIHLHSIGAAISLFRHRGETVSAGLLDLGASVVDDIGEDDTIESIFMDHDFKNRTVLHLITYNGYAPLMSASKVTVLLDKLWQGKLTYKCDGRVSDYSKLTFMANEKMKTLPGKDIKFTEILALKFEPNITAEQYGVQYKFRKSSV